jgi:hypothetical protein
MGLDYPTPQANAVHMDDAADQPTVIDALLISRINRKV